MLNKIMMSCRLLSEPAVTTKDDPKYCKLGVSYQCDICIKGNDRYCRKYCKYALIKNANDINTRLTINYDKKIEIATKAAEMVSNGETVMLESGSTCTLLAEQLAKLKKDITIITNSAYIAIRIRDLPIRKVILLGGEYQKEYQGMVGPLVRKCAKEFYVDKFFVGTDGFIPDAGFTCDDLMRVETMKYMEGSANRMIILADSSKFSQKGVVIQTTFSEIDTVCTDADIPEDALENLKRHNINVEIAE